MKQQTEMMRQILKNEIAQEIIDYVSPVYGESYVALWIYEAIGIVLSEIVNLAENLRYETNPNTCDLLMDYWEDHYGLHRDSTLTMEQRRVRLLDKIRLRAPANPKKLSEVMANVLGVPVSITERVAKNTFQVEILDSVSDFKKMLHALDVLERRKPAHLIYRVHVTSQVDETHLKMATATTLAEEYGIGVEAIKLTLQTTLEKAIKLGAAVSIGENYRIDPETISMETQANVEQDLKMASGVSSAETFNVDVKRIARIAVETAFKVASPIFSEEEFTVEEVNYE